jgi:hypothetical protein
MDCLAICAFHINEVKRNALTEMYKKLFKEVKNETFPICFLYDFSF